MNLFFFVGEVLLIGLILIAIVLDTPLPVFIDIASVLIVLGGTFALTLITFTLDEICRALAHALGGKGTKDELECSAHFWEAVIRNLLLVGMIGTCIGLVKMLQNLSDPAAIGPAMALALLTFFYALVIIAICPLPVWYIVKKQIARVEEGSNHTVTG